jgi:hypothetical protein
MASSQQRVVNSVREFAASRASQEERQRSNRQMIELLRLDKLEEAQRRMAELARYGFSLGAEPMPLPTCDLLPPCLCNELMLLCVNLHGHAGTRF